VSGSVLTEPLSSGECLLIVMTGILIVAAIIPPDKTGAHPEWLFWFAVNLLFLAIPTQKIGNRGMERRG
jgi:hypothetical protein